jgi:hypothetical protein
MAHAREEYLFQYVASPTLKIIGGLANRLPARYSIYVLESSTSRRLTYFMPPLVSLHSFVLRNSVDLLTALIVSRI